VNKTLAKPPTDTQKLATIRLLLVSAGERHFETETWEKTLLEQIYAVAIGDNNSDGECKYQEPRK